MTQELYFYGLLLLPFIGTLLVGYGKLSFRAGFGATTALGALSMLLTYLVFDYKMSLIQLAALALAALISLVPIGVLGEKSSYRSSLLFFASVGLTPWGAIKHSEAFTALIVFSVLFLLNLIFSLLLGNLRRRVAPQNKNRDAKKKPDNVFLLTLPTVITVAAVGLVLLNRMSEGMVL